VIDAEGEGIVEVQEDIVELEGGVDKVLVNLRDA